MRQLSRVLATSVVGLVSAVGCSTSSALEMNQQLSKVGAAGASQAGCPVLLLITEPVDVSYHC